MKYLIHSLLLIAVFTQCTKSDSTAPPTNIFSVTPDANYLLDTVSFLDDRGTGKGYSFVYDNLNRVKTVKYHQFFSFLALYVDGTLDFSYTGAENNPVSMEMNAAYSSVQFHNKVFFFYNADHSKQRDSIINLDDPTQRSVRKYYYNPALNGMSVRHYKNNSPLYKLLDTAVFSNNNCITLGSSKYRYELNSSVPIGDGSASNEFISTDDKVNPYSKLNIFPAIFLTDYLFFGDYITPDATQIYYHIDYFALVNNAKRIKSHYGPANFATYKRTSRLETYDNRNRIVGKTVVDSSVSGTSVNYQERFFMKYKYKD
jgi:hypothetical protein